MNSVKVRILMRIALTLCIAASTVIFLIMLPAFIAHESVGLLGVVFKVITILAVWVFVYRTWKIDIQPVSNDPQENRPC